MGGVVVLVVLAAVFVWLALLDLAERGSRLERENARLQAALLQACTDGWADGEGAMRGYLNDARIADSTEGGRDRA